MVPLAQTALAQDARPDLLRVSRISDFLRGVHPTTLGTGNQELMADIVFSTLVDVDSDEVTILPDLAESWTVSNATTYAFNLNPAAVWSDGEPVTADDVLYTIAYANQHGPAAYKYLSVSAFQSVVGGDEVLGTTDIPSGIKIDEHAVRVTLRGAGLDVPAQARGRRVLHHARARAGRHDAARGRDLRLLPGRGRHRRRLRSL